MRQSRLTHEEQTELCYICDVLVGMPLEKRVEVCDYILDEQESSALCEIVTAIRDGTYDENAAITMEWASKIRQVDPRYHEVRR